MCPYVAHAMRTIDGWIVWSIGQSCIVSTFAGADIDVGAATALALQQDVPAWAAVEMIGALRAGLDDGLRARRKTEDSQP